MGNNFYILCYYQDVSFQQGLLHQAGTGMLSQVFAKVSTEMSAPAPLLPEANLHFWEAQQHSYSYSPEAKNQFFLQKCEKSHVSVMLVESRQNSALDPDQVCHLNNPQQRPFGFVYGISLTSAILPLPDDCREVRKNNPVCPPKILGAREEALQECAQWLQALVLFHCLLF